MARGKKSARAANQRARQHQARVEELRAELAAEQQAMSEIAVEVEAAEVARSRLGQSTRAREKETQGEAAALQDEADLLYRVVGMTRDSLDQVQHQWQGVMGKAVDAFGGGREGLERFLRETGQGGYLIDGPGGGRLGILS